MMGKKNKNLNFISYSFIPTISFILYIYMYATTSAACLYVCVWEKGVEEVGGFIVKRDTDIDRLLFIETFILCIYLCVCMWCVCVFRHCMYYTVHKQNSVVQHGC